MDDYWAGADMKFILPRICVFTVTLGNDSRWGYLRLGFGAIAAGTTPGIFQGFTINSLYSEAGARDLVFSMFSGGVVRPQDFFRQIFLRDNAGTATRAFRTADAASFSSSAGPSGLTIWQWGVGADPVWTSGAGNDRIVTFSN